MSRPLPKRFYARDVVTVARELVGCIVEFEGASGLIVETEAYHEREPACHAYAGLTARTKTLFGPPGFAYVYRSYGVHAMLNAVAEPQGTGAAALIRAIEPLEGIEDMRVRRGRDRLHDLCSGPGKLCQALGIWLDRNNDDLARGPIRLLGRPARTPEPAVVAGPRVGINVAVELPWRFSVAGSRFVSSPRPRAGD